MSIGLVWDDASLQGRMDGCRLAKQETIKPQINEPLHSVCRLPHSPILILQPLLTPNARAKSFRYLFLPTYLEKVTSNLVLKGLHPLASS